MVEDKKNLDSGLRRWWASIDHVVLSVVVALALFGVVLSFSVSPRLSSEKGVVNFYYVNKHIAYLCIAFFAIFVTSFFDIKWLRRCATIAYIFSFLSLVFLPWFGTDFGKGAVRWYSLFGYSVQPIEFVKVFFIIFGGWLMSDPTPSVFFKISYGVLASFVLLALTCLVLVLQPDYGQAILLFMVWGIMFFLSGASIIGMCIIASGGLIFLYVSYIFSPHFAGRIDVFLGSLKGELQHYQTAVAQKAVTHGGIIGQGPGEGLVKKSLPDAHTDFIFAVAAEEYGFVGGFFIVLLYVLLLLRVVYRLWFSEKRFICVTGGGLVSLICLQGVINIGVSLQLLPTKGMTLPFVSYGGSSLVAAGLVVGALLVVINRKNTGNF
jgi:cell division protein FtsW